MSKCRCPHRTKQLLPKAHDPVAQFLCCTTQRFRGAALRPAKRNVMGNHPMAINKTRAAANHPLAAPAPRNQCATIVGKVAPRGVPHRAFTHTDDIVAQTRACALHPGTQRHEGCATPERQARALPRRRRPAIPNATHAAETVDLGHPKQHGERAATRHYLRQRNRKAPCPPQPKWPGRALNGVP